MADNSIKAVNTKILNLLADAGIDGLHTDDILYLLGFETKHELTICLRNLHNSKQVQEVGGNRWRKASPDGKQDNTMNGNGSANSLVTPSLQEELPVINLPGGPKFSSYKNSLQEYCQKKHLAVPHYRTERENNGMVGIVVFSLNTVRSTIVSGSVKEAETRVAYDSLSQLGYLKDAKFEMSTNQLKRSGPGDVTCPTNTKQAKGGDHVSFKSQLNELAQQKKIPLPTYETVNVTGGFFATVTFNNTQFKALATKGKRKDAEQNAAQVALNSLVGVPLPSDEPINEQDVTQMVSEARQASQPVPLKNRLQEYCQRLGKPLPTYTNELDEEKKMFKSTVVVQGVEYSGPLTKGKKDAEKAAAEMALKALELMA